MQYQITSDNIDLSQSMELLAKEKTAKLEHKLVHVPEDLKTIRVVMNSAPNEMFLAKLLLTLHGKEYYAEETDYTLESALVKTVDVMERMLEKAKMFTSSQEWKEARELKRLSDKDLAEPVLEEGTE